MINQYLAYTSAFMGPFMKEQKIVAERNKEEIQKCVDKFFDASKYPRKKKKRVRKECNKHYSLLKWMQDKHKELTFGFFD